jgi:transposase InsO family protein
MPWLETNPVIERKRFIMEWQSGELDVTELCRRHGISRKTAYKWIARYKSDGPDGLEDRSRRPHSCPWAADPELIEEAIALRYSRRQRLGVRKIRPRLIAKYPDRDIPSERTLHNHFVRRGLVKKRRRSGKRPHPGRPTAPFDEPNSIWSADFKGQFKTLDGVYCYPLTVQDGCSRYLIGCQGLIGARFVETQKVFRRLFRDYGLPQRIRTDNGVPFASTALGRLSSLSVWWIKLGVLPDLIEPASPQQNGRHERMHKTLKADTTIPPAGNRSAQQRRFNEFRSYFNEVRPHESLNDRTPASVYEPSPRPMPSKLTTPDYPAHFEVRKVSDNGGIRWHSDWVNVTYLLGGEYIGLEEIAPDVWAVHFGPVPLGWLHTRKAAILDHDGTPRR